MIEGFVPWPAEVAAGYRSAGLWKGLPLGSIGRLVAREEPGRTAVIAAGRTVTYAELDVRADRLASGLLAIGLRPGNRIVVQLPNCVELLEVLLACFRSGVLPVLALPAHRRREIEYLVQHTEAAAYIAADKAGGLDYRLLAEELLSVATHLPHVILTGNAGPYTALDSIQGSPVDLPDIDCALPAFFLLSGGTTGPPKLIPRTHDDYLFQMCETAAQMRFGRDGVYLAALPIAHNAALGCPGALGALAVGATVVCASTPSPDEAFPLIATHGVTLTTLVPAFVALWVEMAADFDLECSQLTIEVGGARLDPAVACGVRSALGATLTQWFGMAEGPLCFTRPDDGDELASTTQGRPLCFADELRLVNDDGADVPPGQTGELLFRGPTTLRGYYNAGEYNQRAFTVDGFLRTGDLASLRTDGLLRVEGRVKDVINRGGEKVGAEEIENYLLTHPAVADAAVVPVDDASLGEKTCAVIVPRGTAPTLRQLRGYLHDLGIAEYKLPDRLEQTDALPYTSIGKVDKKRLRNCFRGSTTQA